MSAPRHTVILGMGLMGCDIAAIFLAGGWRVTAVEPAEARWPEVQARVRQSITQLEGNPDDAAHLALVNDIAAPDYASAEIVIEAVPERLALKQEVFGRLDTLVPAHIPVVSNASGYRITDIAGHIPTRARCANLHFFLPAHLVPGVEVVRGEHTDPAICDAVADIMNGLGRKAIRVAKDVPGFLANRIQHALMREAFAVIDQRLASAEDVDNAVRYCFGFRYVAAGPITQKELAGLETQLEAGRTIYPSLCNSPDPSPTLARLVAENRLGPKTGRGFRDWPADVTAKERARYEKALLAGVRILKEEG
ncbi:3-hydroxyacyl-CoA dehydrogenase family protein [Neoroseomonas oryzicola]|uniref:3-hydroxyacyl-CoA dehydrogenase n=1 Tax=Neoroseomonas oryzicola TaxID=535904 RepID=A0A9X9WEY3_9PROT|nr:3-hydroxyacyl-CoA dehydrogenase NAD-binding domain-containing protein [Neoroseomonas oryzicola]MBR0658893.1 3-hydroxyacyl-CoA dehydrogenase [Neoroseomonas oryzicola]NKE15755.1 3-hydroxyacyl-CoA dehydrogenase [Neoroseomonas oryzicola]